MCSLVPALLFLSPVLSLLLNHALLLLLLLQHTLALSCSLVVMVVGLCLTMLLLALRLTFNASLYTITVVPLLLLLPVLLRHDSVLLLLHPMLLCLCFVLHLLLLLPQLGLLLPLNPLYLCLVLCLLVCMPGLLRFTALERAPVPMIRIPQVSVQLPVAVVMLIFGFRGAFLTLRLLSASLTVKLGFAGEGGLGEKPKAVAARPFCFVLGVSEGVVPWHLNTAQLALRTV